eukprot:TRINITY_DN1119_c0_g1_i1.p1 TRINITY_DN1119_c0_g1~~TRINITY_DN1119_c0_g1_i1.p1  ORF type:complete len:594 (+),score=96.36 TRINITY_DN1119_c0_g1_i1:431-2212(+)
MAFGFQGPFTAFPSFLIGYFYGDLQAVNICVEESQVQYNVADNELVCVSSGDLKVLIIDHAALLREDEILDYMAFGDFYPSVLPQHFSSIQVFVLCLLHFWLGHAASIVGLDPSRFTELILSAGDLKRGVDRCMDCGMNQDALSELSVNASNLLQRLLQLNHDYYGTCLSKEAFNTWLEARVSVPMSSAASGVIQDAAISCMKIGIHKFAMTHGMRCRDGAREDVWIPFNVWLPQSIMSSDSPPFTRDAGLWQEIIHGVMHSKEAAKKEEERKKMKQEVVNRRLDAHYEALRRLSETLESLAKSVNDKQQPIDGLLKVERDVAYGFVGWDVETVAFLRDRAPEWGHHAEKWLFSNTQKDAVFLVPKTAIESDEDTSQENIKKRKAPTAKDDDTGVEENAADAPKPAKKRKTQEVPRMNPEPPQQPLLPPQMGQFVAGWLNTLSKTPGDRRALNWSKCERYCSVASAQYDIDQWKLAAKIAWGLIKKVILTSAAQPTIDSTKYKEMLHILENFSGRAFSYSYIAAVLQDADTENESRLADLLKGIHGQGITDDLNQTFAGFGIEGDQRKSKTILSLLVGSQLVQSRDSDSDENA